MDKKIYVKDLSPSHNVFCATQGDNAPLFTADAVINRTIAQINLEDYKGKWVILFFYPNDFTPV